jgi:AhpD family alkylhydroperoxidase
MRGPSDWSVGDRELMAAYVSQVNASTFCIGAHTATARQAYQDGPKVAAGLADLESAPI